MFRNYLKIAYRNFSREKIFSWINVSGLAIGISCFLLLLLFIQNEHRYDRANPEGENIYRLFVTMKVRTEESNTSKTSGALGPALLQNFPEIVSYTRIGYYLPRTFIYNSEPNRFGSLYAVDSTFFQFFPVTFLAGDPASALREPNSLVLTETAAKRIFKDEIALGKTIQSDKGQAMIVTGVIEDFRDKYHFGCDILESINTYTVNPNWLDLWYSTYIKVKPGTSMDALEQKFQKFVTANVGPAAEAVLGVSMDQFYQSGNRYEFHLQPFPSIYLHSYRTYNIDPNTEWSDLKQGDILYVFIFSGIAVFILLLAIINFMNLATAKSDRRAREVGIRKTFGSDRTKLVIQFISEAILMTTLAMLIAVVLVKMLLPAFNQLVGRDLSFVIVNPMVTILVLAGFILVIGIAGGSYPAFYLTSFQPNQVLKSMHKGGNGSELMRSILVVMQFSISIALVIGTLVINRQLNYIQNKGLGFDKEHLIMINNGAQLNDHMEAFKQSLLQYPNIKSVTNASRMFQPGIPGSGFLFNRKTGQDPILCQYLDVDDDFVNTYQMQLAAGRFFSDEFPADTANVVINEAAARAFTTDDPINAELTSLDVREKGKTYKIIGVIKDFNYESLHTQVRPLVLHLSTVRQPASIITIRLANDDVANTISYIDKEWNKSVYNGEKIDFSFTNAALARLYEKEQKTRTVSTIFSGIAIFIACIGLFGLAAFVTEQRTKEIGVRKILGASITKIIILLSQEFAMWVLISNLIAWPVAFLTLKIWLSNFAYRTTLDFSLFAFAGLLTLFIALTTVAVHTFKAARANPVRCLKHD